MVTVSGCGFSLSGREPSTYDAHPVHGPERTYRETNCYADVLIELLHSRGHEPLAVLGFLVRTEWEGDQFTYAKPPHGDLERLFGVDVHEMLPYRTVPEHIEQQLILGRTVLVEIDAWYLPDTEGTSYRRGHLKTTIAPDMIDRAAERMRYFHNGGFHELSGEDYRGAFRLLPHFSEDVMFPFIEVVRFDVSPPLRGEALRNASRELLAGHYARRPEISPFAAWAQSLPGDVERMLGGSVEAFHEYAFVTARMVGSAFELLADHITWLFGAEDHGAAEAFRSIAGYSATVSFRLARRRAFDTEAALAPMLEAWDRGMRQLGLALQ